MSVFKPIETLLVAGLLVSSSALACPGCNDPEAADPPSAEATTATATATLKIEGMTCASCAVAVRKAATSLDGVVSIEVDVAGGKAIVDLDEARVTAEAVAQKITDLGYRSIVEKVEKKKPA
jgi:mercuric ion binding protein